MATIEPGDSAIFFNFRADRGRQLSEALLREEFAGWPRGPRVPDLHLVTLARYEEDLPAAVAFPPMDVVHPLARVVSEAGMGQFHSAETEKYPHVTFFLNGGREEPFPGEERVLIPSPKVATYDLQPRMSALPVTDAVVAAIASGSGALAALAGPWRSGLDPVAHVYPAIVWVLVIWVAVHAALGIIMLLYALARSLAGRMTPVHDGDVRNVTVYQHFFALSAVTTFPVIAFFPGLG